LIQIKESVVVTLPIFSVVFTYFIFSYTFDMFSSRENQGYYEFDVRFHPRVVDSELICHVLAELQRAKRASEAPWVRKIGNPSSRENLVMTSAYDRASERASERQYRLEGRGKGVSRYSSRNAIFLWRFFV